jgi:hypothetical protein
VQARGLFPVAAAPVVWQRCAPDLCKGGTPQSLEAAMKLLIFFPHHGVALDSSLPWNKWAQQVLEWWRPMANNSHWTAVCMAFLSRLAKHDTYVRRLLPPYRR